MPCWTSNTHYYFPGRCAKVSPPPRAVALMPPVEPAQEDLLTSMLTRQGESLGHRPVRTDNCGDDWKQCPRGSRPTRRGRRGVARPKGGKGNAHTVRTSPAFVAVRRRAQAIAQGAYCKPWRGAQPRARVYSVPRPPAAIISTPVTNDESSEAKKVATVAISWGWP